MSIVGSLQMIYYSNNGKLEAGFMKDNYLRYEVIYYVDR